MRKWWTFIIARAKNVEPTWCRIQPMRWNSTHLYIHPDEIETVCISSQIVNIYNYKDRCTVNCILKWKININKLYRYSAKILYNYWLQQWRLRSAFTERQWRSKGGGPPRAALFGGSGKIDVMPKNKNREDVKKGW